MRSGGPPLASGRGRMAQEENVATAPIARALRAAVTVVAVAMSLYHMWVAGFGPPEAVIFRGTHLLFALTLVFLLFPLRPGGGAPARAVDLALLLLGWGAVLHIYPRLPGTSPTASSTSTT